MTESKIDLTDRLRREKRWEEAAQYKDSTAKQLRDGGMKRGEANEAAWESMAEKYPPLAAPQEEESNQDLEFSAEQTAGLPPGSLEDFFTDADWVYGNLERGEVDPATAPSSGALALLKWATRNKNDFFGKIVPRALATPDPLREARREEKAMAAAEHRRIDRLEGMLGRKPKRLEDVLGLKKPEPHED